MVALEIKWKAPKAHTLLELVYVRWGRIAHVVRHSPVVKLSHMLCFLAMSGLQLSAILTIAGQMYMVWRPAAHSPVLLQVFFVFAVVTNLLVSLSMLQGDPSDFLS